MKEKVRVVFLRLQNIKIKENLRQNDCFKLQSCSNNSNENLNLN